MCRAIGREGGSKNGCPFQSDGPRGTIWGPVQTICKASAFTLTKRRTAGRRQQRAAELRLLFYQQLLAAERGRGHGVVV